MKTQIRSLALLGFAAAVLSAARAADAPSAPKEEKTEKKSLRVLAAPEAGHRVIVQERQKLEMESVSFLGVETSNVSATTCAQLGLQRGTGLVVTQVMPKSPAAEVLKMHDILLQLDDQILIEVRQLAVLVRGRKEGDEVTLTYLRGGQKATAKVKLGKHDVPKLADGFALPGGTARTLAFSSSNAGGVDGDSKIEWKGIGPDGELGREEWDRVLGLLQRARPADGGPGMIPPAARIRIDHGSEAGTRAMSINTSNSSLVFSDGDGSLELTIKDGAKTLVAKDARGTEIFSGPATTPEDRKAIPDAVRGRLEKLEGMHDITFRTDGDFKGTENRLFRSRGISLPLPATPVPASRPVRARALFY